MALNTQLAQANILKSKTIGLIDDIRADGYSYTTLLTVLNSQTLKIEDGVFSFSYAESAGTNPIIVGIFINISGLRIPIHYESILPNGYNEGLITLKDILVSPIVLKTGDTITIEFVFLGKAGAGPIGTGTGKINATLLINDYQQ